MSSAWTLHETKQVPIELRHPATCPKQFNIMKYCYLLCYGECVLFINMQHKQLLFEIGRYNTYASKNAILVYPKIKDAWPAHFSHDICICTGNIQLVIFCTLFDDLMSNILISLLFQAELVILAEECSYSPMSTLP